PPHGWHFPIRLRPNHKPRNPCFKIACFVYSEQVGVNRQELGKKGEIPY
ncbi:MAG: hypothetical protein ACI9DM_002058, partial [Cyclobacteriaceae bacterium]